MHGTPTVTECRSRLADALAAARDWMDLAAAEQAAADDCAAWDAAQEARAALTAARTAARAIGHRAPDLAERAAARLRVGWIEGQLQQLFRYPPPFRPVRTGEPCPCVPPTLGA